MANKKTNTKKTNKRTPAKKSSPKNTKKAEQPAYHAFAPWLMVLGAILLIVFLFFTEHSGAVGKVLHDVLLGLFSVGAYFVPLLMIVLAVFWKKDAEEKYLKYRIAFAVILTVNIPVFYHGFFSELVAIFDPKTLWTSGVELTGGGFLGGLVGSALTATIGRPGLFIVSIILILVFGTFILGFTPHSIFEKIKDGVEERKEIRAEQEAARKAKEKNKPVYTNKPEAYLPDEDDDFNNMPDVNPEIFDRMNRQEEEIRQSQKKKPKGNGKVTKKFEDAEGSVFVPDDDLKDEIVPDILDSNEQTTFVEEEKDLEITRGLVTDEVIENKEEIKNTAREIENEIAQNQVVEEREYVFPDTTLLAEVKAPKTENIAEELNETAQKLVDILRSFKVNTKVVDISNGPTITRYELQPEQGVRVRAIANLVDDISLGLAATGVRIEAPIPGKAAVGIEVPKKNVATVYLRDLIENPKFSEPKSKVSVALGKDVGGTPIYCDIAKMPHLLIAGATGMGKSVCINSMIVSMLYKASPKEVKLILIDPKKVEFNIYKDIPHLLVPIVSDPKKAAGSLQWAVGEMERRFTLIEDAGVRDIYHYNMATADDETKEYMPHVVIIIDELADLMMTAPDSVEESICRLAQKARAAGMHLVIGTQRPSVDVITGLIKANVPSRIAFTVASQVDSRTILDMSGAEKLIGRGDMLYAPVGATKPMRVQGAFVSEDEVKKITKFIKDGAGEAIVDRNAVEEIDRISATIGQSGKSAGNSAAAAAGDGADEDPMLSDAIKLAVDNNKISTSLIQRKLSLGYGRAAKLIDIMESMGVVNAPEGNKPRSVNWTGDQYAIWKLNRTVKPDILNTSNSQQQTIDFDNSQEDELDQNDEDEEF